MFNILYYETKGVFLFLLVYKEKKRHESKCNHYFKLLLLFLHVRCITNKSTSPKNHRIEP